jgi:hypothetical protein
MKMWMRGLVLLAVQCVLVLTTAGKYVWERHTRPMVWTRVGVFNELELASISRDPENRYVAVQLLADACSLPARKPDQESDIDIAAEDRGVYKHHPVRKDQVRTIARDGRLVVVEADEVPARGTEDIYWDLREPCTDARLLEIVKFYVRSTEAMPTKLQPGQSVWALVTVPKQGPPRPVELAVSDAAGWHPLGEK